MAERPRPGMDETRAALRRHDERVEDDPAEPDDDAEPGAEDEDDEPPQRPD